MINRNDITILINDFLKVAELSHQCINHSDIEVEYLPKPHTPHSLPKRKMAVYVYFFDEKNETLKVGKVGSRSNARFISQHYNPNSSRSNLAKSLLSDDSFWENSGMKKPDENSIGDWIRKNTTRINFYIDEKKGSLLLNLLEVYCQCRLHPRYEG